MTFPRFPDWLIYLGVVTAIIAVAASRHEAMDAPEPPPPVAGEDGQPLGADLPFDRAQVVEIPDTLPTSGAAFSVSLDGGWATSASVLRRCREPALVVSPGYAVKATIAFLDKGAVAVLQTPGGAPALSIAPPRETVPAGERIFFAGYPQGRAGEVAGRLIGRRDARGVETLAFAESGRTEGLEGTLTGLAGAPGLDEQGRVVGVVLSDEIRRGTLHTSLAEPLQLAIARARKTPSYQPRPDPVTAANYYRVADELRRQLSIVPLVCLAR